MSIVLRYLEGSYAFVMEIDDEEVGTICASGDNEWASHAKGVTKRLGTSKDILDCIDDVENYHNQNRGR
jgi:hypothetical protein